MAEPTAVSPDEIREDFAQRLKRRFEALRGKYPTSLGVPYLGPAENDISDRAGRIVDLVLAECNGEGKNDG